MKAPIAIALLGVNLYGVAQEPKTTWSGVYTEAQAKRGDTVYATQCASCHSPDLSGVDTAPSLTGTEFNGGWNDLSLNDLLERILTTMPADKPGTLSRQDAADVIAFILGKDHFPTGETELPTQAELLKRIKFLSVKPQ
jgi:cytochrome c